MIYISYIVFIFLILRLAVSIANLLFVPTPSRFKKLADTPFISILIPARNEEQNLPKLLDSIIESAYSHFEVLVYDDESTDNTFNIIKQYQHRDTRIKPVRSEGLPEGWLGKTRACHNLARQAKGEYLLFLDADVRIGQELICKTIWYLKHKKLALLSIFPKQQMITTGEKLIVPIMNWILLTLLPLPLIRLARNPSLSAANGQFMLFDSEIYKKNLWHEQVKDTMVEDIQISRYIKQAGFKTDTIVGDNQLFCRMYKGFRDAFNGLSRSMTAFFGNSIIFLIIFLLITTAGFIPVYLSMGFLPGLLYVLLSLLLNIFFSISSHQPVIRNIVYIIPRQFLFIGIAVFSIVKKLRGSHEWKGRIIREKNPT